MKILIASIFALTMLGTTAASADVGAGIHIGGLHVGANLGINDRHHHHRHCVRWRHGHCVRWSW